MGNMGKLVGISMRETVFRRKEVRSMTTRLRSGDRYRLCCQVRCSNRIPCIRLIRRMQINPLRLNSHPLLLRNQIRLMIRRVRQGNKRVAHQQMQPQLRWKSLQEPSRIKLSIRHECSTKNSKPSFMIYIQEVIPEKQQENSKIISLY